MGLGPRVVLLLGLALLAGVARGLDSGMAGLLRVEEPPPEGVVEVVRYRAGFDQARTEDDLWQLFKDNLDADMAPFRRGDWSIRQLADFVLRFNRTVPRHEQGEGNAALVVVRSGAIKVHWLRGKDNHWRMACIEAAINGAKALRFPDSAFILNIDDFPICTAGLCPLPVFTMYKKWHPKKGNIETNEVLMPVFNHHYEDLYIFPWDRKRPKAFMRASQQGCMAENSTRAVLAVLSENHPEDLDLGITRIDGAQKHHLKYRFSKAGFVSIEDHAKWKYLVSADGCVAQTRMAKVMLSNSVVLKEESDWIEYYYRSLKPWKHYVPLYKHGEAAAPELLALVKRLQADDKRSQQIAETAQKWAYRYLPNYPRLLYFRRTLLEYNKLFPLGAMERWVANKGPEALFPPKTGSNSNSLNLNMNGAAADEAALAAASAALAEEGAAAGGGGGSGLGGGGSGLGGGGSGLGGGGSGLGGGGSSGGGGEQGRPKHRRRRRQMARAEGGEGWLEGLMGRKGGGS